MERKTWLRFFDIRHDILQAHDFVKKNENCLIDDHENVKTNSSNN